MDWKRFLRIERKTKIDVVVGDITTIPADAIVNAAKSSLMGGGGVDGAIHAAGGPTILLACQQLRTFELQDGLSAGDAVATIAGDLPADYVIHTVGPRYEIDHPDAYEQLVSILRSAYRKSLYEADRVGAKTITFPLISSGVYGWPLEDAIHQAVAAVRDTKTNVRKITFVTRTPATADLLRHEIAAMK